jgi:uncharacterized protein (TIGR03118 family)
LCILLIEIIKLEVDAPMNYTSATPAKRTLFLAVLALALAFSCSTAFAVAGYQQTNLVSDGFVPAVTTDADLINPWGISFSPTSPFWVSNNGNGLATLYNGAGAKQGLVVTIPAPISGQTSTPTGQVFNPNSSNFKGDRFIFATEDGTIAGWQGGTVAPLRAATPDAVYKGLAIGNNGSGDFLYAANFTNSRIDVFDSSFALSSVSGSFTDPTLPAGYAPFNIQKLGVSLYVTYALKNGTQDSPGAGHGFVDVFDLNGNFVQRLISQGALNSPWGLALAPADFGKFSNDLLVGNHGDGLINAFDPATGALLGTLSDTLGNPIQNDGLWGLTFGNGGNGGDTNKLYFTAGLNDGADGLFASLSSAPVPGSLLLLGSGLLSLLGISWRRNR